MGKLGELTGNGLLKRYSSSGQYSFPKTAKAAPLFVRLWRISPSKADQLTLHIVRLLYGQKVDILNSYTLGRGYE